MIITFPRGLALAAAALACWMPLREVHALTTVVDATACRQVGKDGPHNRDRYYAIVQGANTSDSPAMEVCDLPRTGGLNGLSVLTVAVVAYREVGAGPMSCGVVMRNYDGELVASQFRNITFTGSKLMLFTFPAAQVSRWTFATLQCTLPGNIPTSGGIQAATNSGIRSIQIQD